jgi:outer membrane protein OmpA-like peptidoglycan-associated protein
MKKTALALSVSAALIVAGCTTNPYTGEEQLSKTAIGGGVGAAAGAATGAIIGALASKKSGKGAKKGALIGAALGTIAGLGVGAYMDKQEAELRRKLAGTGVRIVREGNDIRLVMPSDITFDVDRADIKPRFFRTLNAVAIVLNAYPETDVLIAGHTDSTGSEAHNQRLSEARAAAVMHYLVSQGVDPNRIDARGFGERYPIADNRTEQGRALNRRVEIRIRPRTR